MGTLTHPAIVGLDVSCDTLDIHCLPDGLQLQLPNTDEGRMKLEQLARERQALVCFEATGGHEWLLWAGLEDAGVEARQLPPAQIKAFAASRGVRTKTDRLDAETIANQKYRNASDAKNIEAQPSRSATIIPGLCSAISLNSFNIEFLRRFQYDSSYVLILSSTCKEQKRGF